VCSLTAQPISQSCSLYIEGRLSVKFSIGTLFVTLREGIVCLKIVNCGIPCDFFGFQAETLDQFLIFALSLIAKIFPTTFLVSGRPTSLSKVNCGGFFRRRAFLGCSLCPFCLSRYRVVLAFGRPIAYCNVNAL